MCGASPNRCDDDGRLIHLSLASEGLDCKFPRALADMRSLTCLDLTFNQLDGRCALLRAHEMLAWVSWLRACLRFSMRSCIAESHHRHSTSKSL